MCVYIPHSLTLCVTERQVVRKRTMSFQSLEQQIKAPKLLLTDYAKMENPDLVFWGLLGLHDFVRAHGRYPEPRNDGRKH